jgi:hypothetical protein
MEVLRNDQSRPAEGEGLVLNCEVVVAEEVFPLDVVQSVGEERQGRGCVLVTVSL